MVIAPQTNATRQSDSTLSRPTPCPLRKSHLYSSLWQSCDQLRGGMDASQYKDYVLTLRFMKYVSDKYAGSDDFADITVPPGGSFADMVALKQPAEETPLHLAGDASGLDRFALRCSSGE